MLFRLLRCQYPVKANFRIYYLPSHFPGIGILQTLINCKPNTLKFHNNRYWIAEKIEKRGREDLIVSGVLSGKGYEW